MITDILSIFSDLNVKKVMGLVILALIVLVSFPFIEDNFIRPSIISRQIKNLDTLVKINKEELKKSPELEDIYNNIVDKLQNNSLELLSYKPISKLRKFIHGGFLGWILFIVVPFVKYENARSKIGAAFLCLVIGAILGGIGLLIPDFRMRSVNLFVYPGLQLILIILVALGRKKKS